MIPRYLNQLYKSRLCLFECKQEMSYIFQNIYLIVRVCFEYQIICKITFYYQPRFCFVLSIKRECEKICKIVLNHNIGLVKNRLSSFLLQTCGIPQHINTKIGQYFIFCTNKYLPHLFVKQQSYFSICYYRAAFNAER